MESLNSEMRNITWERNAINVSNIPLNKPLMCIRVNLPINPVFLVILNEFA